MYTQACNYIQNNRVFIFIKREKFIYNLTSRILFRFVFPSVFYLSRNCKGGRSRAKVEIKNRIVLSNGK